MSIQSEIDRLNRNVAQSYEAVRERGGAVPEEANSDNLAAAINTIPKGNDGPVQWEDINGRPDLSNISRLDRLEITIHADTWDDNNEAMVSLVGFPSEAIPGLITPVPTSDSKDAYYECDVMLVSQSGRRDRLGGVNPGLGNLTFLTFKAESIPDRDLDVYIYLQGVSVTYEYVRSWWSPKMTSNNSPIPFVASASAVYNNLDAAEPYNAFDGDNTSGRYWYPPNINNAWIKIDFGAVKEVYGIRLYPTRWTETMTLLFPQSFIIYGSNDDTNWDIIVIIGKDSSYDPLSYEPVECPFKLPKSFRYYKISDFDENYNESIPNQLCIGDIQFEVLEGGV